MQASKSYLPETNYNQLTMSLISPAFSSLSDSLQQNAMWYETKNTIVFAVLLIPAFAFTQQRQLIPEGITGTNEISNALKWERTNAPNERLTSFLMEFYNMGV